MTITKDQLADQIAKLGILGTVNAGTLDYILVGAGGEGGIDPSDLAKVATTNDYNDLDNKPVIPSTPADINAATASQGALADTAVQPATLTSALSSKVDKVDGKQLSSNDYTNTEKAKLTGIENGAQVNTVTSVSGKSGAVILTPSDVNLSNVNNTADADKPISSAAQTVIDLKVDKVSGKQLSTNDYTTAEQTKLSGIAAGAQVNTVNSVAGRTGAVILTSTDVGLANVNNTSDANKPVSTSTQTALDAKVTGTLSLGVNFATTTVDTSTALYAPVQNVLNVAPTAASQAISFSGMFQSVYTSSFNLTGGGHFLGVMGWGIHRTNATVIQGIGVEGRYDHGGTGVTPITTRGNGVLGLLSNAAGTMTNAYGVRSEIQNQSGATITNGYGFQCNVSANAGTFTKFVGYSLPLMTGVVTVPTSMLFMENLETQAPAVSMSPIINQAYTILSGPATGFSTTVPVNISFYYINPAAALAAGTVTFPLPALLQDGMEITICSTYTITSFTLGGNGANILNPVTTLTAGVSVRYKFFGRGVNIWARI